MGLDPTTEQRQLAELARRQKVREQAKNQFTQQTSDQIGQSYAYQPWAQPGIHMANGQIGAPLSFQEQLLQLTGQRAIQEADPEKPKKAGFWERNVYGKFKTASRWMFAGMQTLPDLVQNAASDLFDSGPEEGGTGPMSSISGWWHSTSLGSMMSDSTKAGSGFFAGDDFNKIQAERARRYRGEVNGHAFTIGRKAAYSAGLEDGLLYNILSGTIDAATNLTADPTNAIGKGIKTYKLARTAFEVTEETGALAARVAAGLAGEADELAWNQNQTVNWLRGNVRFKNLATKLAETNRISDVMDAYGDRIPLEVAALIAEESDPKKIEALIVAAASKLGYGDSTFGVTQEVAEANKKLFGALQQIAPGMAAQNLREIPGAKTPFRMIVQRMPLGQGGNKWLSQTPQSRVLVNGTAEQRVQSFRNMSNALNTFGKNIDETTRADILERFAKAYSNGSPRDFVEAQGAFNNFIRELLRSRNIKDDVIDAVIRGEAVKKERLRAFFINKAGNHTDGGLFKALHANGLLDDDTVVAAMGGRPTAIEDIRFVGPTASIDFIDRVQILPDFKRISRLTKNPFYAKAMDSKAATRGVELVDLLQNEIWKTTTLMTMGYIMRNLLDGQLRYSLKFSGQGGKIRRLLEGGPEERQAVGFLNSPKEFVAWAMHKTGKGTIAGEEFVANGGQNADKAVELWARQQDKSLAVAMADQTGAVDDFVQTGEFVVVQYSPENTDAFVTGVAQQMEHYRYDTISRMLVEGQSTDSIVDFLLSPAGQEEAGYLLDNLERGLEITDSRGVVMRDPDTGAKTVVKVNVEKDRRQVLKLLVDHRYRPALEHLAKPGQGLDELRMAFLTGRVGLNEYQPVDLSWFDNATMVPQQANDNILRAGTTFELDGPNGPEFWAVDQIRDTVTSDYQLVPFIDPRDPRAKNLEFTVRKLSNEEAFIGARGEGSESLKRQIAQRAGDGFLPKSTIYENYAAKQTDKGSELLSTWRSISRWFFDNVSGKAMMNLEKDPIFRQLYYKNVYENVELLSPAEAQKALDRIRASADAANTTAEKWATKGTIKRLEAQAASNSTSIGTLKQLNEYAGRVAGYEMSDILFDAAGRSNIEEALRIAAPFGAAWREVLQKWAKLIAEDPAAVLRAQRAYNGLSEASVAGGEGGFFYKDPVTGERMFTFPLSGQLTKLISGGAIEAPLAAPVKRLTMGFNVMPSIGPMGQMAASTILPDKPMFDDVRDILLPYGETKPGLGGVVQLPGWAKKLEGVWSQNTIKSDTVYATTYIDVLRALSATGDYDLSLEADKNRLMDDAKDKARWITVFRAASQFLGPTAGAPQYKLKLQGGDLYAGELVKEFQKLQAENYDTAVGRFLEMYGQEAELYISSKTKAKYGGLEATDEFSNFERGNEEFFNRYKEVAGYFAPEGSEFSFAAWDRQLRTGKRERLTDVEVIRTAQNAIGSYKYRQLRLMFGSYPSSEQRLWLRQQRSLLARQYPGFPEKAVFEVGKLEQFIERLDEASQYPGITDLPVTNAIRSYLDARDQAIQSAQSAGIDLSRSIAAQPLRDWLIAQANQLISEVPSFGRVFDRELAAEIED